MTEFLVEHLRLPPHRLPPAPAPGDDALGGNALRRLGFGATATAFYDEHVEADAVHEQVAAHDLAAGLAREGPRMAGEILFGARALLAVDRLVGRHLLDAWGRDDSSLRRPLEVPAPA
jgi:hypothetical protein